MKRSVLICVVMILAGLWQSVVFCAVGEKPLRVVVTSFPLYDFSRQIGGDAAAVTLLLPPGVEAHSFEPKPSDMFQIARADVFVFTNDAMEPWAKEVVAGASQATVRVVDASAGIALMHDEDHADGEAERGHQHDGADPHVWLDLDNAQKMVMTIAAQFAAADPARAAMYLMNAEAYARKLAELDARFAGMLTQCPSKTIIYGGHFAFGYFAKRYGLASVSPYAGFAPDAEPTPKAIVTLIETMKREGNRAVFYEELIDPKVARTIAAETGAELLLLSAAHNVSKEDIASGVTFLAIMERNLESLKRGLGKQ